MLYFSWWYIEEPKYLWRSVINATWKIFNLFSVALLLKTLFAPWKRDITYVENASLQDQFNIWIANLISRVVGFVVRTLTVFAGVIVTMAVLFIGLVLLFCWVLLPAIIILLLINGLGGING